MHPCPKIVLQLLSTIGVAAFCQGAHANPASSPEAPAGQSVKQGTPQQAPENGQTADQALAQLAGQLKESAGKCALKALALDSPRYELCRTIKPESSSQEYKYSFTSVISVEDRENPCVTQTFRGPKADGKSQGRERTFKVCIPYASLAYAEIKVEPLIW